MGAAESQGISSQIELNHPSLRNCKALTKNSSTYLQASLICQKPQYEQWKKDIDSFQQNDNDSTFLLLPLKHKFEQGGVCSTAGDTTVEYDYYPQLLSSEIKERMKDKKKFSEAELWYLLYVMVAARDALLTQGRDIGDLQPRNIFLNANQHAKIANPLSWPGHITAYRKAVLQQSFQYLSPEDIDRLKLGAMDNKNNTGSQIFAMGLTLLSASSLQPMIDLYRIKQRDLDEQLFQARIAIFQQDRTYSQIFRSVVCNLLEMDPLKRMSHEQLSQFLFKHRQNLQNKKPLLFDNVGRKLQQSINVLVKIAPTPQGSGNLSNSNFRSSNAQSVHRLNSRSKEGHPPHSQHINFHELNQQQPLRSSNAASSTQKNKNIFNYELNSSGARQIPVSPTQQRKIVFNHGPVPNAPTPLYLPPKPVYHQTEPLRLPNNTSQFYPDVSQQYQPNNRPPFKPFDNIRPQNRPEGRPGPAVGPALIEESKVQLVGEKIEEGEQKQGVGQLLMQTRRGGFLVEMSKVERKDSKAGHLGQNSILKNKTDSSIMIEKAAQEQKKSQQPIQKLKQINEKLVQAVQKKPQSTQLSVKDDKKSIVQIDQQQEIKKAEEPNIIKKQSEPIRSESENILNKEKNSKIKEEQKLLHQSEKIESNKIAEEVDKNKQKTYETNQESQPIHVSKTLQNDEGSPPKMSEQDKKSSKVSNEGKNSETSKFISSVKVWGFSKGKLTIQEVGNSSPLINIPKSPNNNQAQKLSASISVQVQQVQTSLPQVVPPSTQQLSPPSTQQLSRPSIPQLPIISSPKIQNSVQIPQTNNNNYILIQQPSRTNTEIDSQPEENSKNKEEKSVEPIAQPQTSINENMQEQNNEEQFIFQERATDGNFQECWEELIKITKSPQNYCSLIKPQKVEPLQNQYGQYLKVGPARVKVNLNKEQGKIWLQNLGSSLCQGTFLCGVVKRQDKLNYLWCNSSLNYKGKPFPPMKVISQGLEVAQNNIKAKHKQ